MNESEELVGLEESLMDLHVSVNKLIRAIRENYQSLESGGEILNKLPILDFYNDDLLRNIGNMRIGT